MADDSDHHALLADAEATAVYALERVQADPDRVLALRDVLLFVLDVVGQLHDHDALRAALDVLRRLMPRSVAVLHEARQLIQTTTSKANPVLKAMLLTLSTLADRSGSVPLDVFSSLVQLVHQVCATSMSSADVVQLFEFLRVSRAPARRLILQMQTSLLDGETIPRAVFTMSGVHAGIIAPSTQMVFPKKGYSLSFGLLLEAGASVVSLYSFRGKTGQGVSGMIEGSHLVLKLHSANGSTSQVIVPFSEWRLKMESQWVHVCIVHAKKMVFKDKIAVFADGVSIFSGNLSYPDPLCMVGGQNCIGVIPAVSTGFRGRMWSPTLFGQPLSESEIQKLHWLTHWKSDLGSATAENTGMSDKSKFIFSYDARSCDVEQRICFDISGNDCHGWMEPGTKAFVTQGIRQVMDSVGGSACFLLLLLDQIPEMADFHPKQELAEDEISDLLSFVSLGLRTSVACRAHFLRLQGVNVLAFIIQSVSPQYLTLKTLDSVVVILESILQAPTTPSEASDYIQLLLFRNANWFLSPFDTQVKLLGEILPTYIQILDNISSAQILGQRSTGLGAASSAMGALGILMMSGVVPAGINSSSYRTIDVSFFCNLLVQVYAPRLGIDATNGEATSGQSVQQLAALRHLIIHNLIDRLLFPPNSEDDLHQWRQLLAHIYHRCSKVTRDAYAQEGEGSEVKELLNYLTRLLSIEASVHKRTAMAATLCKLSKGTLRLWWHAMHSQVPDIRLEALKLFEAYCTDKVMLKRRDAIMLVATHQAYPIDIASSDVLLDLVIGRKHVSYYRSATATTPVNPGRSINIARLEFLPLVLLGLVPDADFDVQLHILFEVKILLASSNVGQTAVEAMRSWPPWLGRLVGIIHRANVAESCLVRDGDRGESIMSDQALNAACSVLSDEHSSLTAKIDAIQTIGQAGDVHGCDFALSMFQCAGQPASVVKAIVCTVKDRFPSRCSALVSKVAQQLIVDVTVYSILHVRNGWLHFLELYFCVRGNASELGCLAASIVDRLIRRVSSLKTSSASSSQSIPAEHVEFMWENLSQVASIVALLPTLPRMQDTDGVEPFSTSQQRTLCRKAFELWSLVLPRLHLINWDDMKSQLLQNVNLGEDIAIEDKEIFCYVVAASPHARFLAVETTLSHLKFAHDTNEISVAMCAKVKKVLEMLRLIAPTPKVPTTVPAQNMRVSFSAPTGGITDALAAYIADATAFFGETRSHEAGLSKELVHLHALDTLYHVLVGELRDVKSFDSARSIGEVVIAVASAAIKLHQSADEDSSTTSPAVIKSVQIIASTDLTFFGDISQLQQLISLWGNHHDTHTQFVSKQVLQPEVDLLNAPFEKRWARVLHSDSSELNPYLIQRDASKQAEILAKEDAACEILWREIADETAVADAALFETIRDDDRGLPATLKQDAERFASSVHKLIVQSTRASRLTTVDDRASEGAELTDQSQAIEVEAVGENESVLLKVNSRENNLRMRLRLKCVRENYRLRNVSCECADASFHEDDHLRLSSFGPRRFKSARDNIGGLRSGVMEHDKTWRSETGSDYSDFLADAQMRAAIIRSCPSAGSDRDSFGGDLSDEDDDDDLREDGSIEDVAVNDGSAVPEVVFDMEVRELVSNEGALTGEGGRAIAPVASSPDAAASSTVRSSGPSSPLGSLSAFGASILSVVGGVTEVVTKAAKDAKDAVEFGVDSIYTARDVLSDDAQSLVHEVSTALTDSKHNPPQSSTVPVGGVHSNNETNMLLDVSGAASPPSSSVLSSTGDGPILFPPTPPTHERNTKEKVDAEASGKARRGSVGGSASKRELEFEANLVRHMNVVAGKLVLTESHLWFVAERVIDEHETVLAERKKGVPTDSAWRFLFKRRCWKIDDIASLNRRRYLLKPTALEIFIQSTRKNYFFSLTLEEIARFHEALMARRPVLLRRDPTMRRLRHPSSIFRNSNMSVRWMNHEVSTFEYLMWLNTIAGRTYNDLTQYPVFPWVIADYDSPTLDLARASTFRELSKPMGALDPARLKFFLDRYHAFEDSDIPKFMYGTHYSNIGVVLYYMIRLEPFTSYALNVQGGKFDHADRLFHSIAETWNNCLHDFNDVKELTPEWFYLPEFLKNCNHLDLGTKQSGVPLGDVVLPNWACSPEDFVLKNLMALESEYVSANIHQWIDLIFGASQRGPAAVEANNVYFYLTYEGMVDVDSITDPVTKSSMRAQIAHFGQTPTQVLREPHPPRLTLASKGPRRASVGPDQGMQHSSTPPRPLLPSHAKCLVPSDGRFSVFQLPHDHPVLLLHMVPGTSSIVCVDSTGLASVHRYGTKCVKVHHTPFMNDLSSTASKASGVFKSPHGHASSPTGSGNAGAIGSSTSVTDLSTEPLSSSSLSSSSEYIELHDRKSRRIVGERRLVTLDKRSQATIAFLNSGAMYCSVDHHDFSARFHSSSDGALLYRLLQHNAVVKCVSTSTNGSLLALGSADGTISVWKVAQIASTLLDSIKIFRASKSSRPVHANDYAADQVLLGHASSVNCVAVSDDLGVCVSGSTSNECLMHDLADGSILQQFSIPGTSAPGVVSLALSPVGYVVVQSMGLGSPMLYAFHINGSLLAKTALDAAMVSLSICSRFSKVIVSNADIAIAYSSISLGDKEVLLERADHGDIFSQAVSPDETHAIFGTGAGKLVSLSLLLRSSASPAGSVSGSTAHLSTTTTTATTMASQ